MNSLKDVYAKVYQDSILDINNKDYKNTDKGSVHSYIDYYDEIFSPYKNKKIKLLEIGVQGGISLLMWKEYFQLGEITGVDISISQVQDKISLESKREGSRIRLVECDGTKDVVLEKVQDKFDIIIDDGSHTLQDQIDSFRLFENRLNDGGIFVIEDIGSEYNAMALKREIPKGTLIDLRHIKGRWDDLILVYRKETT